MKKKSEYFKEFIILLMILYIPALIPIYIIARRIFTEEIFLQIITTLSIWFLISVITTSNWYTEDRIEELEKEIKELKNDKIKEHA